MTMHGQGTNLGAEDRTALSKEDVRSDDEAYYRERPSLSVPQHGTSDPDVDAPGWLCQCYSESGVDASIA